MAQVPSHDAERTRQKREAATLAVEFVQSGMVVGLGAGSTASFAIERIAALVASRALTEIRVVPCSVFVEGQARRLGLEIVELEAERKIDVTIDGADEVDPKLDLIKGAGGALLREKIVAQASRREIIIVDEAKCTAVLGTCSAVPVEVVPFGWRRQLRYLEDLGARATLRMSPDGTPFRTDQGHYIIDAQFGPIRDVPALAASLDARAGVVEHGLFLGLATDLMVADASDVRHLRRGSGVQLSRPT